MEYLDLTLPTPAANLACDEALLQQCEEMGTETLRFWEPSELFVVAGFSNSIVTEVDQAACRENRVGIFRRCTGGGAVLQGPGCLNYSLVLKLDHPGLGSIPSANCFIMERHRAAISALLQRHVQLRGHTDLALDDRKFSGNAQRRLRSALLFHGSFLLAFDFALMEKFLAMPSRQPQYRAGRNHEQFLTNLPVNADALKDALRRAWDADVPAASPPHWRTLADQKYSRDEWNLKF